MKRKVIPALVAGTLAATQFAAHAADFFDLTDLLQDVYRELTGHVNKAIAEDYDPEVASLIQGAVNTTVGTLGFTAPYEMAQELDRRFTVLPQSDVTEPVPASQASAVVRNVNRDLLRQQIETVLGQDGQQTAEEITEDVTAAVDQTQQHAETAQSAISTQAAIKEMAQQAAISAELLGALHTETLQGRQDTAAQSLALADISESLDQQLTGKQLERRNEAVMGLQQAAAARLF
ncbi:MAG: hypothetical protein AAGF86_18675 [Pseudomonadota bacterium]